MDPAISVDTLSLGLLFGRLTLGLRMAAHGAQKLFGWFGGYAEPAWRAHSRRRIA